MPYENFLLEFKETYFSVKPKDIGLESPTPADFNKALSKFETFEIK
jgi:hypothetical protein